MIKMSRNKIAQKIWEKPKISVLSIKETRSGITVAPTETSIGGPESS